MKNAFLLVLTITLYGLIFASAFKMYMADIYYVNSKTLSKDSEYLQAINSINTAISLNKSEPAYYREKAKIYLASLISEDVFFYKLWK